MKRHYLLLLTLLLVIPMLYLLPSYGVLLGVSIMGLLMFSTGVAAMILLLTAVEKIWLAAARLLRRGWNVLHSRNSMLRHS